MRLFDEKHVSRFRSIRKASLEDAREFSVLAGLGNSRRSNLLWAINPFLTGAVEPGVPFRLGRDYNRPKAVGEADGFCYLPVVRSWGSEPDDLRSLLSGDSAPRPSHASSSRDQLTSIHSERCRAGSLARSTEFSMTIEHD